MDLGWSCRLVAGVACPPTPPGCVPPSGDMEVDFVSSGGPFDCPDPEVVPLVEPATAEGLIDVNADSL